MGEIIAFAIVMAAVIVVIAVYGMNRKPRAVHNAGADTSEAVTRMIVHIPEDKLGDVATELSALHAMQKPGSVEFYENQGRIIRLVVD